MAIRLRIPVAALLSLWLACGVAAQSAPAPASAAQAEAVTYPVSLDGRVLFTIANGIGGYSAQERAEHIQRQLTALAEDAAISPDAITARDQGSWSEIIFPKGVLMAVTDADAASTGIPRAELTSQVLQVLHEAVPRFRKDHSWESLLRALLNAALATAILVVLIWLWVRGISWMRRRTDAWLKPPVTDGHSRLRLTLSYLHGPLVTFFALVQWMVVLILLQTYAVQVLRMFPETREASTTFTSWLLDRVSEFGAGAVAYLPNLLLLIVLGGVTYYVLRANNLLFNEIGAGNLQVNGFYPDWARPTAGLVRVLILMLAAVVMFPYLPGARTPAFQGISIFLGALLSFGGSSAVANAVAGTILTYMRSFQLGDWVRIGDVTGEVTEKSLLVTRVRTPKNEIVTIPNSSVMNGSVMNYSGQARTTGVVFHTTVTIGYDAPWRTVHELLVSAAFATNDIEPSPKPFVLQTALNDFYVSYELNAFTRNPNRMPAIYSELHQNIQDKFNEAGVEIMSPHYSQLRDGNQTTTPANYLPSDYKAPGFRMEKGE